MLLLDEVPTERLTPKFYRSDILGGMKLSEIQCPGSMWGQYTQLYDIATGTSVAHDACRRTAHDILALGRPPIIHHLLDNSSLPLTMRYFIRRTMEHDLKYWGESRDVRYVEVNFVRSHSYFGLASENLFETRLRQFIAGKLDFDLPPVSIFDQKIFYALPFDTETRHHFDEEARALFPYTAILFPEGVLLPSGERRSVADLFSAPSAERQYVLKYAGMDTDRNWGSRAVHDLALSSRPQLAQLRAKIEADFPNGHYWIIQERLASRGAVEFTARDGSIGAMSGRKELRAFYGPSGLMGALAIHRKAVKVHGADDSVFSLCRE
ncbi:hypothetical protein [Terricaulis sp.]|uniref:hypothetical protein n=1 Tax=Terricaulis sp. TaxID=2768686 RepID=UPI0037834ABC